MTPQVLPQKGADHHCAVKVVCRFCGHEFWAGVKTDGPVPPDRLYEVHCPCNGSRFLFRIVKDRPEWADLYRACRELV